MTRRSRPPRRNATSGARSADDLYIIYTGGTTGMPKGVMWRQEDIFFAGLGGGDPVTGEPLADECGAVPQAGAGGGLTVLCRRPPLMHGAAQVATWSRCSAGRQGVLAGPSFDAAEVWRTDRAASGSTR